MKSLKESLFDKDLVTKEIKYHPKTKDELIDCIKEQLEIQGPNANLNIIDVSDITDMSFLFSDFSRKIKNIDISKWDVNKVKNMSYMFYGCRKFNCDLSKWNMSDVRDMRSMFGECTNFNSDLSKWNVSKVKNMSYMFSGCEQFNSDLSKWDVRNVKNMYGMFYNCQLFNSDLSKWNVSNVEDVYSMFCDCKSLKKIPSWYEKS